jgi:hypothetical protein
VARVVMTKTKRVNTGKYAGFPHNAKNPDQEPTSEEHIEQATHRPHVSHFRVSAVWNKHFGRHKCRL